MKRGVSQKILAFSTLSAPGLALFTFSTHPSPWTATVRPTDTRDSRLNKIAYLRAAIAAGTYRVSPAELAEKIIDHLRNNA